MSSSSTSDCLDVLLTLRTTSARRMISNGGLNGAGSSPHVSAAALQLSRPFNLTFSSIKPTSSGKSVMITSLAPISNGLGTF